MCVVQCLSSSRFGAALLHKFDDCVGIEILEGLHGLAEQVSDTSW